MKRFNSMNYSSHNINSTDDNMHNTKNLIIMDSKDHNYKARSTGTTQYENMGDSIDSYLQRGLDPALSLSNSSSNFSHNSISPRKNVPPLSPKKTSKFKLYQKSEPLIDNPTGKKRAGVLYDKQSDICNNKRAACYNHFGRDCSEGEKVGAVINKEMEGVECSMCGDVGIAELLFLCSKCSLRPQHTYCGRSYPNVCGEASICNWCLHEQDSSTSSAAKGSNILLHNASACETNAQSTVNATHPVEELQINPALACVNEGHTDEALVEVVGRHGKAFDYLLLVAAQSGLPQVISGIKQTNQTASMINITGSKILNSSHKKANGDSDRKAKMGLTELSNGLVANQARISKDGSERSMTGLVEKLNRGIQSAVKIKVEARSDHGGVYAGESMPKRQRCSKGVDAPALKCSRKRGLQLSPARPNYRRYKLLADVVC